MLAAILRVAITVLSGVGIGSVLDKFAADKIPVSTLPIKQEGGFVKNIGILIALSVVGTFIAKAVIKKLKLTRQIKL